MYKFRLILFILCCTTTWQSTAQYSEKMRALRPGYGVNPWTVGEKVLQLHAGYNIQWGAKTLTDAVVWHDNKFGNLNLCYGITEKLELQAFTEVRKNNTDYNHLPSSISGISQAALGVRYNIVDAGLNGLSFGLQAVAKLPVQSPDFKNRHVLPRIMLLMGWNVSSGITLVGNLGVEYDGVKDNPTGLYSFKALFDMSNRIGSYIETHNTLEYAYPHTGVGLYLYISKSVMLDAGIGTGFKKLQKDNYFNIGLSARLAGNRNQRHRWVYGEYR